MNPYRKGPRRLDDALLPVDRAPAYRAARLRLAVASASILCAAAAVPLVARALRPGRAPTDVPSELLTAASLFPAPLADLAPSVPLEPLLVADAPDRLAVLEPTETALNLRPGERVTLRFNRPMVDGQRVGKPIPAADSIVFSPAVHGRFLWTSRSALSFEAAPSTWADGSHTTSMTLSSALRSLGGEEVTGFDPRTVVFDGGPRFVGKARGDRLMPGETVRLLFSGKLDVAALPSQLLVYEVGGGRRMIPFRLAPQARDARGNTPVDLALGLALDPGGHLAVAVAPPLSHGGSSPRVVELELAPRPRIEGIACAADATRTAECAFSGPPGQIVDIGETLVLLASADLEALPAGAVEVSPPLDALAAKLEAGRRLVVRGDWASGQVYQVRVTGLRDREGHALERTPPLAVRSAGRAPEVRVATGRLTYERDARAALPFAAIRVEDGEARLGAVPPGREIEAALFPGRWVGPDREGLWASLPLHPLVPSSKPNRWASGALPWLELEASRSSMMVLSLLPDRRARRADALPVAFVQQTDLGIDARVLPRGVLAWITSVASARPVGGARVTLADRTGKVLAEVDADDRGLAWFPLDAGPLDDGAVVRAVQGADRAVLVVDPRSAIGPRHLGLTPGTHAPPADAWLATVFTDRGICRPGETLHAKALVRGMVDGALQAPASGRARLALFGPSGEAPLREQLVTLSAFGTVDADFPVDAGAALGAYRVEARFDGQDQPAGSASFTVGEYRPPTYRVDLGAPAPALADRDPLRVEIAATHLFGPPAAGMRARWTLTRARATSYPDAWNAYAFDPVDVTARAGTVASGDLTLDTSGHAAVETTVALSAPVREELELEVSVQDLSGLATSARRALVTYPATFEIGVRRTPAWIVRGATLDVDAAVISHDGAAVTGRRVEARIVREGWHTYWEWSGRGRHDEGGDGAAAAQGEGEGEGGYQARRAHKTEVVQRCALTSGDAPVHCTWAADRAGTYLLEATTRDDRGRTAVASQRVYVAGPDEHPDRDPPGTAITLTPARRAVTVGEDAEVAFESPFPEAEALLEVERDGALVTEVRHVSAGGNVFRFPVTAAMVPNAYVSLALVRPRTGPPGEKLDLAAPDLRVGLTELTVRPAASPLTVTVDAAASAPAGTDVAVTVVVADEAGRGVSAEVALFAVDEGTLRTTGYALADPLRGLFPRLPPAFAWEDLRRSLVSRLPAALLPGPGGDGEAGGKPGRLRQADDEARFEPTPLWAPRLVTDAAGRVSAVVHLPARPTQYRIMALAADDGVRAGRAERTLVATMPLVVRPVLPGFATVGDRFEAAAFVHNTEDAAVEVTVTPVVDGLPREPLRVHLEAKAEARVATTVEVARTDDLVVRFEARSERFTALSETRVRVSPRGRVARSEAVGAVAGSRTLTVQIPDAAADGSGAFTLSLAAHPFVGLDTAIDALLAATDDGVEATASSVIGLSAYARLDTGKRPGSVGAAELGARAATALARLSAMQAPGGGFGMFTARDNPDGYHAACALHAFAAARRAGFAVDAAVVDRARAYLEGAARDNGFLDADAHDELGFALRVLAETGSADQGRVTALFEQRERLSPYGLAQLALAMDPWDRRRDTLVVDAQRRVLATRDDERAEPGVLRAYDGSARTLGAVLEAALAADLPARDTTRLASRVLATRGAPGGSWWSNRETSYALSALAAYAATVGGSEPLHPRVALDGAPLIPASSTAALAWYTVPAGRVSGGAHQLRIEVDGAAWFALGARWIVPLGPADSVARGQEAALHRVLEDAAGKPLGPDTHVKLGDLVRVRLFLFSEHGTPPYLALRDRLAGGLEPVDAAHETTAKSSLWALLGMGPDDDVLDARGHYAARSLDALAHRSFLPTQAVFYLTHEGPGLHELTYGVRAVAVGTFVLPPAELEALYAPGFTARSAARSLTVDP